MTVGEVVEQLLKLPQNSIVNMKLSLLISHRNIQTIECDIERIFIDKFDEMVYLEHSST